ncbi:MAG: Dabb family protein [Firmicutes bacterium]|nr:Dabb family protein [Bacillota bacterium]
MVKHMIIWKLKLTGEELEAQKKLIKNGLEGLAGKIPGMTDIQVQIENLPTSNADMMLDSTFESPEALKGYSVHPEHVHVAETYIRPYIETRLCIDYEV